MATHIGLDSEAQSRSEKATPCLLDRLSSLVDAVLAAQLRLAADAAAEEQSVMPKPDDHDAPPGANRLHRETMREYIHRTWDWDCDSWQCERFDEYFDPGTSQIIEINQRAV